MNIIKVVILFLLYAIRSGDWSLIANKSGNQSRRMERFNYAQWQAKYGYVSDDNVKGQLFDMKTDSAQRMNLILQKPKKVAELTNQLRQIQRLGYSAPRLLKDN